jgi:hypothetical protein
MAGYLSDGDLAQIRDSAEHTLPSTCSIQTATSSADTLGGFTKAWANTATAVPCRLARPTESQLRAAGMAGGAPGVVADWFLSLPHDRAVTISQRIVIGDLTLEPVWVNTGKSYEVLTRMLCREVTI